MQELARQAMREGALGVGRVSPFGGMYISHLRSEGNQFLEALDELITIAREAQAPAEVYHLKAGGRGNWPRLDLALHKIEQARKHGTRVTACMRPWVQEGGPQAWFDLMRDAAVSAPSRWENLLLAAGTDGTLLRGTSPEDTTIDLVPADESRVDVAYLPMPEENTRKQIRLPWVSFGSDAGAAPGRFLRGPGYSRPR